ncbi:ribose-phosphate diphosphokinase [Hydrogenophaga sp. 5NK40-0174]|uniref:ribose-phosphate diphosphokinase n=1 Tax=Hydrogenophaga sp. 5NK40-0174 TaxID=3127649 RepID=UPI00310C1CB0
MTEKVLVLSDEGAQASASHCAGLNGWAFGRMAVHRFPDGEVKVRLPPNLPEHVVIWQSLNQPNDKLVTLMLAARTARQLGARELTLVAPYMAYMRQDMAFEPGEAVSQRIVGDWLASLFDRVVTIDPHLHRVHDLQEAIPVAKAIALSGAPLLAGHIASRLEDPVIVGPDEESAQWVAQAAQSRAWASWVCTKVRRGDRDVTIDLPAGIAVAGRDVVLMDDVASSGRTLVVAASLLLAAGARQVDVAVTHALFAGNALELLKQAGVANVWSTDAVPHATNVVSVASMVAESLR